MKAKDYTQISKELEYLCADIFSGDTIPIQMEHVYRQSVERGGANYRYQRFMAQQRPTTTIYVDGKLIATVEGPRQPVLYRHVWDSYPEKMYLNLLDKVMDKYPGVVIKDEL